MNIVWNDVVAIVAYVVTIVQLWNKETNVTPRYFILVNIQKLVNEQKKKVDLFIYLLNSIDIIFKKRNHLQLNTILMKIH